MFSQSVAVPIRLPESWGGLANSRGVLRLEGESLQLEFVTHDSIFEAVRSDIKRVSIPFEAIESFELRKGFFGWRFELTTTHLEALQKVPGGHQGRVAMPVGRRDRPAAERLLTEFQVLWTQRACRWLEQDVQAALSDPPKRKRARRA
ncbi:MAG: hypothetical protein FJ387_06695 [Verrucomicrobia bacterium]|nr:hypothetical protein [Verrucomicrobiota bacterium]